MSHIQSFVFKFVIKKLVPWIHSYIICALVCWYCSKNSLSYTVSWHFYIMKHCSLFQILWLESTVSFRFMSLPFMNECLSLKIIKLTTNFQLILVSIILYFKLLICIIAQNVLEQRKYNIYRQFLLLYIFEAYRNCLMFERPFDSICKIWKIEKDQNEISFGNVLKGGCVKKRADSFLCFFPHGWRHLSALACIDSVPKSS